VLLADELERQAERPLDEARWSMPIVHERVNASRRLLPSLGKLEQLRTTLDGASHESAPSTRTERRRDPHRDPSRS
jgi:hypothetical protein